MAEDLSMRLILGRGRRRRTPEQKKHLLSACISMDSKRSDP